MKLHVTTPSAHAKKQIDKGVMTEQVFNCTTNSKHVYMQCNRQLAINLPARYRSQQLDSRDIVDRKNPAVGPAHRLKVRMLKVVGQEQSYHIDRRFFGIDRRFCYYESFDTIFALIGCRFNCDLLYQLNIPVAVQYNSCSIFASEAENQIFF